MKRLIIIDGNAIIHRSFHAIPNFKSKKGEAVGALYGFISFFLKITKEYNPDFIVTTFDLKGPTFRHIEYSDYKAKRKKAPDELYSQIPKVKEFLKSINISIFEKEGYEADDIIGTISSLVSKSVEVIIFTGDFDCMQLVNKNVKVFALERGIKQGTLYDEKKVIEKYSGLYPKDLINFKALRGDPSDNIPGIVGIGEKTAIEIVKNFSTIENLYKDIKKAEYIFKEGIIERIKKGKENAFLSKKLSEIKKDVPIEFNLENTKFKEDRENEIKFLEKYNFKSLISRIDKDYKVETKREKKNMTLF